MSDVSGNVTVSVLKAYTKKTGITINFSTDKVLGMRHIIVVSVGLGFLFRCNKIITNSVRTLHTLFYVS